jgi:hypothetical protein
MAGEAVVSPIAEGAARVTNISFSPRRSTNLSLTSAANDRAGTGALLVGSSSNWGLGGTDGGTLVLSAALGCGVWQIRGGGVQHEQRFALVRSRPPNITAWRNGLFVFEIVIAWPSNAVGADNGILWGYQDSVNTCRPSAGQCFAVRNDTAGALLFTMVGAVGTQDTVIGAGLVLTDLLKVRVECRSATKNADASVSVFLNDAPVAAVVKTSADANFPAIGAGASSLFTHGVGCGSAVNFLHVRDWNVWNGPNTTVGM